jgi:hypothetical protein
MQSEVVCICYLNKEKYIPEFHVSFIFIMTIITWIFLRLIAN